MNTDKTVNFKAKINKHFNVDNIDEELTMATNEYLVFLIKCFNEKNDFHVDNFNRNGLIHIKDFYTKLKTNILRNSQLETYNELFRDIKPASFKCMNFIIINYINTVCPHDNKKLYIKMQTLLSL